VETDSEKKEKCTHQFIKANGHNDKLASFYSKSPKLKTINFILTAGFVDLFHMDLLGREKAE